MKPGQVWYLPEQNKLWLVRMDYSPYPEWVFETPDADEWFVYKPHVDEMRKEGRLVFIGDLGSTSTPEGET